MFWKFLFKEEGNCLIQAVIILSLFMLPSCQAQGIALRDGDIIFQTSQSSQSEAVQRATHSKYSHMGLILTREGKPFVFEAVNPVRFTPLKSWIQRGKGAHYVVKRLKDSGRILSDENILKI